MFHYLISCIIIIIIMMCCASIFKSPSNSTSRFAVFKWLQFQHKPKLLLELLQSQHSCNSLILFANYFVVSVFISTISLQAPFSNLSRLSLSHTRTLRSLLCRFFSFILRVNEDKPFILSDSCVGSGASRVRA